jgi:hypothetical protein
MEIYQSRFKFYLVSPEQRIRELPALRENLSVIDRFAEGSDAEKVVLFLFCFLQQRRPDKWWMSSGQQAEMKSQSMVELKDIQFPFLKRLKSKDLIDVLLEYRLKNLPDSIFQTLWMWAQKKYPLILLDRVPTPFEMLGYQAEGKRAVTLDMKAAQSGELVDGKRDAFEFLLHDLIHADLFFANPDLHIQQVEFFKKLKQKVVAENLLVQADEKFLQDLNYLMSDMNSHGAHLEAHWQAILIQWKLRQENKNSNEKLSALGREWVQNQSS